jgi:TATA-box binding protein (TBP) (component of TFIID and TFIIIB)
MEEEAKVSDFAIQNIVSTFNAGRKINLYKFHQKFRNKSLYEPEMFPGLSYKFAKGLSLQVFWSGKIVMTGAKNWQNVMDAYEEMKKNLKDLFDDIDKEI